MEAYNKLIVAVTQYEKGDPHRVHHFLKVLSFARLIAQLEKADDATLNLITLAAITHDMGIAPSRKKYGDTSGKYQQIEGPIVVKPLLNSLGYSPQVIDRVCFLVAHHHTYTNIQGLDYQILVEADFLVNIFDHKLSPDAAQKIRHNIFRTKSGLELFDTLYSPVV